MPKPQSFDRLLWKAADQIHRRLHPEQRLLTELRLPETPWLCWQACLRRIRKARNRQWAAAGEIVRQQALDALAELGDSLGSCRGLLASGIDRPSVSSVGDIYRDLASLRNEFPKVTVEFSSGSVSVTTEPIVLEETYLGPFEIRLHWNDPCDPLVYEVSACDPQPAATSDDVTHPHVEANQLCEGDGRLMIRQALQRAHLLDFFLIVRQILETYNAHSAYVQLNQWSGRDCRDCGAPMCEDEAICCAACETDVCGECARDCLACGSSLCGECQAGCPECARTVCRHCLKPCTACRKTICEECLYEERCPTCREADEEQQQATETGNIPSSTAVQPLCVGQAVVSA
jgi:hypothetical protein